MNTKHFKNSEFGCKHCGSVIENSELKLLLELIRLKFGGAVIITSGTRCETHNKKVGGKPRSKHLLGSAADIHCTKATPEQVYNYLNKLFPDYYGIAAYKSRNFTHVDVDKRKWRKVYA